MPTLERAQSPSIALDYKIVRLLTVGRRVTIHAYAPMLRGTAMSQVDEASALLQGIDGSQQLLAPEPQSIDLGRRRK